MTLQELKTKFLELWDNPSTEHDARSILSAFKVGVWLTLFNVLMAGGLCITVFVLPEDYTLRRMITGKGMGPCLMSASQIILTWFLTLVLPLRAAGLLDGPRWSGYFDQVVCTGISPFRFFLGKFLTSQIFILVLMGASVPYIILFSFFGIHSAFEPFSIFLQIYVYANVLILATFALGTMLYEWAAVVLVTLFSAFCCFIEFFPLPNTFAFWTPTRSIVAPYAHYVLTGGVDKELLQFYNQVHLFGLNIPVLLFKLCTWGFFIGLFTTMLSIGPRHFFAIGLNNFESVTLAGDSKRAMFFRLRPLLSRRVQLATFYENKATWLTQNDLLLRFLIRMSFFSFLTLLVMGTMVSPWVSAAKGLRASEYFGFLTTLWMIVLGLNTLSTLRIRTDYHSSWVSPLGPKINVVTFDFIIHTALFLLALGAIVTCFFVFNGSLTSLRYRTGSFPRNPFELGLLTVEWMAISYLYLLSVQIVAKLMGMANLSRVIIFVFMVLYMLVSLLGPLLIGRLFENIATSARRSQQPSAIFEMLASVGHFSPVARMMTSEDPGENFFGRGLLGQYGFWLYFPMFLGALLLFFLFRFRKRIKDPGERFTAPTPPPPLLNPTSEDDKAAKKVEKRSPTSQVIVTKTSAEMPAVKELGGNGAAHSEDSISADRVAEADKKKLATAPTIAIDTAAVDAASSTNGAENSRGEAEASPESGPESGPEASPEAGPETSTAAAENASEETEEKPA